MPTLNEVFANAVDVDIREFRTDLSTATPRFNVNGKVIFLPAREALPAIDGMSIECRSSLTSDIEQMEFVERAVDALDHGNRRFLFLVEGDEENEAGVFAYSDGDPKFPPAKIVVEDMDVCQLSTDVPKIFESMKYALSDRLRAENPITRNLGSEDADFDDDEPDEELEDEEETALPSVGGDPELQRREQLYQAYLDKRGAFANLVNMLQAVATDLISPNMPSNRDWDTARLEMASFLDENNTVDAQRQFREVIKRNDDNLAHYRTRFAHGNEGQPAPDKSISLLDKLGQLTITTGEEPYDGQLSWSRIGHEMFNYGVRVVGQQVFGKGFNVEATDVLRTMIPASEHVSILRKLNDHRHVGRADVTFPQIPGYHPDVNLYELDLGEGQGTCAALHVVDHSGHYLYAWPADKVDLRADMRAAEQIALPAPDPVRDIAMDGPGM